MGLFEKAGRRFEQFKREATEAAEEEADYECGACGARFYTRQDSCPDCGAEELVALDAEDDPEASTGDHGE